MCSNDPCQRSLLSLVASCDYIIDQNGSIENQYIMHLMHFILRFVQPLCLERRDSYIHKKPPPVTHITRDGFSFYVSMRYCYAVLPLFVYSLNENWSKLQI